MSKLYLCYIFLFELNKKKTLKKTSFFQGFIFERNTKKVKKMFFPETKILVVKKRILEKKNPFIFFGGKKRKKVKKNRFSPNFVFWSCKIGFLKEKKNNLEKKT